MRSLGVELEMPVASCRTGRTHGVGPYFHNLHARKKARGEAVRLEMSGERAAAVHAPLVVSGLDNAFNNLESSIGILAHDPRPLARLDRLVRQELTDVAAALAMEDACVINFSEHPCVSITDDFYREIRSPKPVYAYWVDYRLWNHQVGVDAKSHNGPTTGVRATEAVRALNVLLAASPACIALFANSPFEACRPTGFRENRLTIWPRMFDSARFPCDRLLHSLPPQPFASLSDYFLWMFGPGTNMQYVVDNVGEDYKKPGRIIVVDNDPPLLEFLRRPRWTARDLADNAALTVVPTLHHVAFLQFSQFLDARIRYALKPDCPPLGEFLAAMERPHGLEAFFEQHAASVYIEGRAAGANFPDHELAGLERSEPVRSVMLAPSGIQLGLLRNQARAWARLSRIGWPRTRALREQAIRHGLAGSCGELDMTSYCRTVLEAAAEGLEPDELWTLDYAFHVLDTGQNGADRALAAWERGTGDAEARLLELVRRRQLVLDV